MYGALVRQLRGRKGEIQCNIIHLATVDGARRLLIFRTEAETVEIDIVVLAHWNHGMILIGLGYAKVRRRARRHDAAYTEQIKKKVGINFFKNWN